jgi:two-component system response regulator AtoC
MELRAAMTAYQWPGNVRELENFVRKFLILRDAGMLARELNAKSMRRPAAASPAVPAIPALPAVPVTAEMPMPVQVQPDGTTPILEQVTKAKLQAETDAILSALNSTRWNRKRAAALLNIDYKALLYKMKKLGVDDKPATAPVWLQAEPALAVSGD